MKDTCAGSLASRVLEVIAVSTEWITTTQIRRQLDDAEPMVVISGICHDLWIAKKVTRQKVDNRYVYQVRQTEMFVAPASATEPAHKQRARRMSGHGAGKPVPKSLKLSTLDRLSALLAPDIAQVLLAIRKDLTRSAAQ